MNRIVVALLAVASVAWFTAARAEQETALSCTNACCGCQFDSVRVDFGCCSTTGSSPLGIEFFDSEGHMLDEGALNADHLLAAGALDAGWGKGSTATVKLVHAIDASQVAWIRLVRADADPDDFLISITANCGDANCCGCCTLWNGEACDWGTARNWNDGLQGAPARR